jgi:hypothetical protein
MNQSTIAVHLLARLTSLVAVGGINSSDQQKVIAGISQISKNSRYPLELEVFAIKSLHDCHNISISISIFIRDKKK